MSEIRNNIIFIYKQGDTDSISLAEHYQWHHNLDDNQIIGIPCSDNEILANYAAFQSEVENPIKSAILSLPFNVKAIVLGLGVPGGFIDDLDIVSSTSRLSRINYSYNKKINNYLYNRQSSSIMSNSDFDYVIICSRIDAPTLKDAKKLVGYSREYIDQYYANGRIYFDPYSNFSGDDASNYRSDLLDFYNNLLYKLALEVSTTVFVDDYTDVVTPYLQHDSFYWGWFTDRSDESFFKNTDTSRIFFYNADYDSAYTLRDASEGNFAPLAIKSGYFGAAGALSNPTIDGFLRPRPFFKSLNSGGCLGEAYLFAEPYLNWSNTLVGDPLVTVAFPENREESLVGYNDVECKYLSTWIKLSDKIARMIARYLAELNESEELFSNICCDQGIYIEVDLLNLTYSYYNALKQESYKINRFGEIVNQLFAFANNIVIPCVNEQSTIAINNINELLSYEGLKISKILQGINEDSTTPIIASNYYNEGYWFFEAPILNENGGYTYYHFEIDISEDSDFSTVIMNFDSSLDQTGWSVENEDGEYVHFDSQGVVSYFVGNNIRYGSQPDDYMDRGKIYYIRIRQKDSLGTYSYREFEDVIYT